MSDLGLSHFKCNARQSRHEFADNDHSCRWHSFGYNTHAADEHIGQHSTRAMQSVRRTHGRMHDTARTVDVLSNKALCKRTIACVFSCGKQECLTHLTFLKNFYFVTSCSRRDGFGMDLKNTFLHTNVNITVCSFFSKGHLFCYVILSCPREFIVSSTYTWG